MILRSVGIVTHQETAPSDSPSDKVDARDWRQPTHWVAAARCQPQLALVLIRSTLGISGPCKVERLIDGETFPMWGRLFISQPRWDRVVQELDHAAVETISPAAVSFAHLSRSIASVTGWTNMEDAYWRALLTDPNDIHFTFSTTPSVLACLQLARSLLEQTTTVEGRCSPLQVREVLRAFQLDYPKLDWKLLADEAEHASNLKTLPFTATQRQHLLFAAKENLQSQDTQRYKLLFRCSVAATDEEFADTFAQLIRLRVAGQFAVWLGAAQGKGAWSQLDGSFCFAEYASRKQFEERLPAPLRHSTLLAQSAGRLPVAILYLEDPPTSELTEAFVELADIVAARNARNCEASGRSCEDVQWQSKIRLRMRSAMKEFSAGAAHTIHNPLATIAGKAQKLLAEETHPQKRADLNKILHQVARIHDMIRDLHLCGRGRFGELETVTLVSVVEAAMAQVGKFDGGIRLHPIPDDILVTGNADDLGRALAEVIRNAVEAAGPQGTVQVQRGSSEPGWATLRVTDTGPGFSSADLHHAFDPFYSGKCAGRGLGMGLTVALSIAEHFGGTIAISPGTPTAVEIHLPTADKI